MIERLSPAARNLALAVLAGLVIWFSWTVRAVLNPLLLGYLLAFVLHPFVLRLERRGFSRRTAANVIFTLFFVSFVLLAGAIYWQGNSLFKATFQEHGILTKIENGIQSGISELRARMHERRGVHLRRAHLISARRSVQRISASAAVSPFTRATQPNFQSMRL